MDREQLLERLRSRPSFEQLADDLLAIAGELAEQRIRERLQALLEPAPALIIAKKSKPAIAATAKSKTRKPNTCSKCGTAGFTAATCGKTHNVMTSPAKAVGSGMPARATPPPATSPIQAPPPTSAADRRAALVEAGARREAAKQERDERSRSFVRSRGGPTRGEPRPVRVDAEPHVRMTDDGELPEVVSTFTF